MGRSLLELLRWINDRSLGENSRHTPDEVERRLRAGQWINLPLNISQPIIPLLFFFLPFSDVMFTIVVLLIVNVIWMRLASQRFVSIPLARIASYVALARWTSSLIFAVLLWNQGHALTAAIAFFWPILIAVPLVALHRFWPDDALANTQRMFRDAAKGTPTR